MKGNVYKYYKCILVPLTPQHIRYSELKKIYKHKLFIIINNIYYKLQALTNIFKVKLKLLGCVKCAVQVNFSSHTSLIWHQSRCFVLAVNCIISCSIFKIIKKRLFYWCFQGAGTDEACLIEILSSRNNAEIREITRIYKAGESEYHRSRI